MGGDNKTTIKELLDQSHIRALVILIVVAREPHNKAHINHMVKNNPSVPWNLSVSMIAKKGYFLSSHIVLHFFFLLCVIDVF